MMLSLCNVSVARVAARAATTMLWLLSSSCIEPIMKGGSGITVGEERGGMGAPLERNKEMAGPELTD